jgi:hypothetical protein
MPDATLYGRAFYDWQRRGSLQSARRVVPVLIELVHPSSVIDFGCGTGAWLSVFREHGVPQILGIDGGHAEVDQLLVPAECLRHENLERCPVRERSDLALSVEVAEHLAPDAAPHFVETLTASAGVVAFSAAIPGQGGYQHVNEQWPAYWRQLFADRSFAQLDVLRPRIWNDEQIAPWYRQNLFLYAKVGTSIEARLRAAGAAALADFNVVHPALFTMLCQRAATSSPSGRQLLLLAWRRLLARFGLAQTA